MINDINNEFYNKSGSRFDKIAFVEILPNLLLKYCAGKEILEIGSGTGALAFWLLKHGYQVSCIEPAQVFAKMTAEKGLRVYSTTIQDFHNDCQYDNVIAISSLIHVPKANLPSQIQKISHLLKPHGIFIVSLIEGDGEGFEDATHEGKLRYIAKWTENDLESLFSPLFVLLEKHRIYNHELDCTFLLRVYALKNISE